MTSLLEQPLRGGLGLRGRLHVTVRDAKTRRIVRKRVFENLETQYALNSVAAWLVGGAGVVAPAQPSYLSFGTGPINLLTANQADLEAGTTGWQALSNCALAQSATQAWNNLYSLALTASSAATMTATTLPGVAAVPVTAGYQYAASAHFRADAGASARQVGVNIAWYDSGGALLSTSTGTTIADSTSAWTRVGIVATAPVNAVYAAVQATVVSPANAEVHYLDGVQLAYAPDGHLQWQAGYSDSAWMPLRPSVNDMRLSQERYLTRLQADTGYVQQALAVLLRTYQQTDPSGSFTEAALWDGAASSAATVAALISPGATSITLGGSPPAVAAGTQIFIPSAPLASPAGPAFSGASTSGGFLLGGTTYYYEITAVGPNGETLPGTETSYAVPAGTNTNQITLTWTASAGAVGYKVYRGTVANGELLLATLNPTTSTTYVDNTNTVPAGTPPVTDGSGKGEYATITAAAAAGAGSWTLTDQLLYTHPTTVPSGTTTIPATVVAFVGNLWAHVALTGVAKSGTQLLSLQWEIAVSDA